jgi:hypothetical protein
MTDEEAETLKAALNSDLPTHTLIMLSMSLQQIFDLGAVMEEFVRHLTGDEPAFLIVRSTKLAKQLEKIAKGGMQGIMEAIKQKGLKASDFDNGRNPFVEDGNGVVLDKEAVSRMLAEALESPDKVVVRTAAPIVPPKKTDLN